MYFSIPNHNEIKIKLIKKDQKMKKKFFGVGHPYNL